MKISLILLLACPNNFNGDEGDVLPFPYFLGGVANGNDAGPSLGGRSTCNGRLSSPDILVDIYVRTSRTVSLKIFTFKLLYIIQTQYDQSQLQSILATSIYTKYDHHKWYNLWFQLNYRSLIVTWQRFLNHLKHYLDTKGKSYHYLLYLIQYIFLIVDSYLWKEEKIFTFLPRLRVRTFQSRLCICGYSKKTLPSA